MIDLSNKVYKKVIKSAVLSLIFAVLFYALSFTRIGSFELETTTFFGLFLIFVIMFFFAAFWIFDYWCMDRIQKEPIKSILYTFCSALFIHFFIITIFDKVFLNAGIAEFPIFFLLKYVLIPLLSIYAVFDLFIFRLDSFDEFVDSMIYGGFAGVGIGCAVFLNETFVFESLSIRYLVQILLVRLLICSSACSLSGLLIFMLRNLKKSFYMIASIIILFIIFSLDFFLDTMIDKNIQLAQIESLSFIIPFVLTVLVYLLTVIFILRNISKEFLLDQKGSVFYRVYGIVLFLVIIFNCFILQSQLNKTIRFYSDDKTWSFELPYEFSETTKKKSVNSIFEKSAEKTSANKYQEFSDRKLSVYISFPSSSSLLPVNSKTEFLSGWNIYKMQDDSYVFVMDDDVVMVQLEAKSNNGYSELEKEKIIKRIAKSLRKENEK